jgi:hypothetical protein
MAKTASILKLTNINSLSSSLITQTTSLDSLMSKNMKFLSRFLLDSVIIAI